MNGVGKEAFLQWGAAPWLVRTLTVTSSLSPVNNKGGPAIRCALKKLAYRMAEGKVVRILAESISHGISVATNARLRAAHPWPGWCCIF